MSDRIHLLWLGLRTKPPGRPKVSGPLETCGRGPWHGPETVPQQGPAVGGRAGGVSPLRMAVIRGLTPPARRTAEGREGERRMNPSLPPLIDAFAGLDVLVLGEA